MTAGYQGKFIKEVQETTEPETKTFYMFEENEAKMIMNYKGHFIKDMASYHDMFGELTCVKNAIEDAKDIAKKLEIDENSEATLEVELHRYSIKKQKTGRKNFYRKDEDGYDSIGYHETIERKIVWTTKDPTPEDSNCLKCNKEMEWTDIDGGIVLRCPDGCEGDLE